MSQKNLDQIELIQKNFDQFVLIGPSYSKLVDIIQDQFISE